jgi:hypothetical protein
MNKDEAVAYVQAQTACAMIECEAMKAENQQRAHQGYSPAYSQGHFMALAPRYGIDHNSVLLLFQSTD